MIFEPLPIFNTYLSLFLLWGEFGYHLGRIVETKYLAFLIDVFVYTLSVDPTSVNIMFDELEYLYHSCHTMLVTPCSCHMITYTSITCFSSITISLAINWSFGYLKIIFPTKIHDHNRFMHQRVPYFPFNLCHQPFSFFLTFHLHFLHVLCFNQHINVIQNLTFRTWKLTNPLPNPLC